jgi:hypothetical protein
MPISRGDLDAPGLRERVRAWAAEQIRVTPSELLQEGG